MSKDFVELTTRLAAGMSIFVAFMIGAIILYTVKRGAQRIAPAIGMGRRMRSLQLAAGLGIATATIIGALPALRFPSEPDRFERFYGVLGYPIHAIITALVFAILAIGIGGVFRRRDAGAKFRN